MNGKQKNTEIDECFEEYKKEFQLKGHVAVNIEMVKEGMRTKEVAFDSIKVHFENAGFK